EGVGRGARAGRGALPVGAAAFRKAIESRGVAVAANLAGFDIGLELSRADPSANEGVWRKPHVASSVNEGVWGKPQGSPNSLDTPQGFSDSITIPPMPPAVRTVVDHALPRLIDYQDIRYQRRYLARLHPFVEREAVGAIVARHLATWMTYEDAIRVAQAKTRATRFARIRGEARAADGTVVEVTDYLKPDLD